MIAPHIIAAIRAGKLATITRTEWLEVADVLAAKAPAPVAAVGPTALEMLERIVALETASMALLSAKQVQAAGHPDDSTPPYWRCLYRAVARQCAHGKSLDGPCEACGESGLGK